MKPTLHVVTETLLFISMIVCAWFFDWNASDLIWALWVSSITIGYLTLIFGPLIVLLHKVPWFEIKRDMNWTDFFLQIKKTKKVHFLLFIGISGFVAIFYVCFFTIHFGMFHFVHGSFLSTFFPLAALTYPNNPLNLPLFSIQLAFLHWPFVLASAISQYSRWQNPKNKKQGKDSIIFGPYKAVIRMHLMIFVFAGLHALHVDHFIFYVVILFAYFFPWKEIVELKKAQV
ncbi:MAG: hypothetical protein KDD46_03005 [Bdellovibrionales bacterium]|nr:hypothetical protein [Bdellovibrionales bacterium]